MQTVNYKKYYEVMQNLDGYLNSVLKFGDEGNPELDDSDLYDILLKYDDVIDGYYTIPEKIAKRYCLENKSQDFESK